jgi:TRAP-type C4-dicarboxylate transport system permease small subunit
VNAWNRIVQWLVDIVKHIGGAALVLMMLVTTADVITRYFGHPIFGAVEIVSFMATILLACAMPMTHMEKGHVGVDLLVRLMPKRHQVLMDTITGFLSVILFALVCWQMILYGGTIKQAGQVSMSLEFPSYVFVYVVGVAFGVLCIAIFTEFLNNLRNLFRK